MVSVRLYFRSPHTAIDDGFQALFFQDGAELLLAFHDVHGEGAAGNVFTRPAHVDDVAAGLRGVVATLDGSLVHRLAVHVHLEAA